MPDERLRGAPIFVKIEEYKDILDVMSLVKSKINEAKNTLAKINKLKNEEDMELDEWEASIGDVEKKVEYIDRTLFEPDNF